MNDLVDKLEGSFQITKSENTVFAPHPANSRLGQFKTKTAKAGDQNVRRDRYLQIQKNKRFDYKNHARKLAFDEWSSEDEDDKESEQPKEEMETQHVKPPRRYANQLMLSEWMVDKPEDFESTWLMKICPIGKRNLVIASRGRVHVYTRSGYKLLSFICPYIPGGCKESIGGYTVLDCIYSEKNRTFHILDIMCWNGHAFYDCDTEFRFFWLAGKLKDIKTEIENAKCSYNFKQIECLKCTTDALVKFLDTQNDADVDGLLFFHKLSHYTFGTTPLVLWLKPNMLYDMFLLNLPTEMK